MRLSQKPTLTQPQQMYKSRVLLLHNDYAKYSGEEFIYDETKDLLTERGHAIIEYRRASDDIGTGAVDKLTAFASGVYSPKACQQVIQLIKKFKPDVAHLQNVYPLLSPAIAGTCQQAGVPVILNVQNFRLGCPTGLLFTNNAVCHKCLQGNGFWCFKNNCTGNKFKSLAYAIRYTSERLLSTFRKNVTHFITPTLFHKRWLVELRIPANRISVIPNMTGKPVEPIISENDNYVAFAGRITESKGIRVLIEAAAQVPHIPFKVAGPATKAERFRLLSPAAPKNITYVGELSGTKLAEFYNNMTMLIVPSIWYEGLPTVIPQAMVRAKPVIASAIGGLPDIVHHNKTGLLASPGDATELANAIRKLWDQPELQHTLGQAALSRAQTTHSNAAYYSKLLSAFAIARQDFVI